MGRCRSFRQIHPPPQMQASQSCFVSACQLLTSTEFTLTKMDMHIEFLQRLVDKGGPDAEDFYDLDAWIAEIAEQARKGNLTPYDLQLLRNALGDALSVETMQGFVFQKPHGYAGDYEVIDRVYTKFVSGKAHLSKWDAYAQEHACAHAVRNRVQYFCQLLEEKQQASQSANGRGEVLNLASGPGRDMLQFFEGHPDALAGC